MSKSQKNTELFKALDDMGVYSYSVYDEDNNHIDDTDDLDEAIKITTKRAIEDKRRYFITAAIMAFVPSDEVKIIK